MKCAILDHSADYIRGYVDCCCVMPTAKLTSEYQNGFIAGIEAKRVLDELGISTDNGRYPELAGISR